MLTEPMSMGPMEQRAYTFPYLASQENHPQEYWPMDPTPRMDIPIKMTRDSSFDGGNLSYSLSASPVRLVTESPQKVRADIS